MTIINKKLIPEIRFKKFINSGDWEEKKLGDIGEIITGKTPSTSNEELWKDEILFVTPSDMKGNKYQADTERMVTNYNIRVLPLGTIMFSCIATIGKIAIAKVSCTTNQQINSLIVDETIGYNEFIYYSLQSMIPSIKAKYEKDAFSIINKTEFSSITIKVSLLNTEQQKIADFLSSVDELIEVEQLKLKNLKEYKKGLLQNLFPKENQKVPEIRFKKFINSGEWEEKKLGDTCNIVQGNVFPIEYQGKKEGDYPFCKVSDISKAVEINAGYLKKTVNYIDRKELSILKANIILKGTTIFAKIGEAVRLNRRAYLNVSALIDNNIAGVRFKFENFNDLYLFYYMQTIDFNNYISGVIPSINKSILNRISIDIPSHNEQEKIADFLSSVDELIELEQLKLEKLKEYKKGLLQQLFPREMSNE